MTNIETVKKANHFIMLDMENTIKEKINSNYFPKVQIVYPSNEDAYQNVKNVKSNIEMALTQKKN